MKNLKIKFYTVIFYLLLINCAISDDIQIKDIFVDKHKISVELAKNNNQRIKGLSKRQELSKDKGMLFIFEKPKVLSFWMKDTFIPLSIAFINKEKEIIEIHDMQPLSLESISSKIPCLYALEMNKGWFEEKSITKGMKIRLND